MLPYISEFYAKGKELLMSQSYSDLAVQNVEAACWITAAVASAIEFTGVVNDGRKKAGAAENGPNWCKPRNWRSQEEVFAAIKDESIASPHRNIAWSTFWREAKGKCPRLREARDDSKKRDSLPMFFGIRLKRQD